MAPDRDQDLAFDLELLDAATDRTMSSDRAANWVTESTAIRTLNSLKKTDFEASSNYKLLDDKLSGLAPDQWVEAFGDVVEEAAGFEKARDVPVQEGTPDAKQRQRLTAAVVTLASTCPARLPNMSPHEQKGWKCRAALALIFTVLRDLQANADDTSRSYFYGKLKGGLVQPWPPRYGQDQQQHAASKRTKRTAPFVHITHQNKRRNFAPTATGQGLEKAWKGAYFDSDDEENYGDPASRKKVVHESEDNKRYIPNSTLEKRVKALQRELEKHGKIVTFSDDDAEPTIDTETTTPTSEERHDDIPPEFESEVAFQKAAAVVAQADPTLLGVIVERGGQLAKGYVSKAVNSKPNKHVVAFYEMQVEFERELLELAQRRLTAIDAENRANKNANKTKAQVKDQDEAFKKTVKIQVTQKKHPVAQQHGEKGQEKVLAKASPKLRQTGMTGGTVGVDRIA